MSILLEGIFRWDLRSPHVGINQLSSLEICNISVTQAELNCTLEVLKIPPNWTYAGRYGGFCVLSWWSDPSASVLKRSPTFIKWKSASDKIQRPRCFRLKSASDFKQATTLMRWKSASNLNWTPKFTFQNIWKSVSDLNSTQTSQSSKVLKSASNSNRTPTSTGRRVK